MKQISVEVSNCFGTATAQDAFTIDIAPNCVPVTDVTVTGPRNVKVNAQNAYNVTLTPANASMPIAFQWSGNASTGASASYKWQGTGERAFEVTASNCSGSGIANKQITVNVTSVEQTQEHTLYLPALSSE